MGVISLLLTSAVGFLSAADSIVALKTEKSDNGNETILMYSNSTISKPTFAAKQIGEH